MKSRTELRRTYRGWTVERKHDSKYCWVLTKGSKVIRLGKEYGSCPTEAYDVIDRIEDNKI